MFQASHHIACYFATGEEFDSYPLIEKIWQAKKNCYLPILAEKSLHFVLYQENDPLHCNQYKILEPNCIEIFATNQLDLVLVPLVGYDLQGGRLGMGGGYYDRTFSFLLTEPKKIIYLGLAYSCQEVSDLPHHFWDVMLDGVVTEKEIKIFNGNF